MTTTSLPGYINLKALATAAATFVLLYILLVMLMIFALSQLNGMISTTSLHSLFKVLGVLCWAIPGYVAAHLASQRMITHGVIIGVIQGGCMSVFLLFSFSWEAGYDQAVFTGMLISLLGATLFGTLGAAAARHRATRSRPDNTTA